ncbi:peptidoglycan editing factor PgeF [Paludibacterium paludis]|uniref:Purine nucleoside phosphorylase n=1 Tax=Paludibacterium paludis TaxID=1225769 RepID=A0A918P532_9NEIS|nr:peptidoglycan editing factor PgeF [Paludibacterium paludis]GGY20217.1 laccase domain protein [Paludibacterium paludis]
MSGIDGFAADWPAPANVRTLITTRRGGVSEPPFDGANFGLHVGDDPEAVRRNRELLRRDLPAEPAWLNQVHGTTVVDAARAQDMPDADASVARAPGAVCVVMTADCLPVLLCDREGTVVGACHAGWRGLANGAIDATVREMGVPAGSLMAWLGPAIGPDAFEVGGEVREAFIATDPACVDAFAPIGDGKFLADIYRLARLRLAKLGVGDVSGGDFCTVIDRARFFSYRRDRRTGRMASLIWLDGAGS